MSSCLIGIPTSTAAARLARPALLRKLTSTILGELVRSWHMRSSAAHSMHPCAVSLYSSASLQTVMFVAVWHRLRVSLCRLVVSHVE